jgi:hypothetical protein
MAVLLIGFGAISASADALYNSIPGEIQPEIAIGQTPDDFTYSMPFYEDGVSAFGGLISNFNSGGAGTVSGGTIAFSSWALASNYSAYIAANPTLANATGFDANITVSVYNVGASSTLNGDTVYALGSQIASQTTTDFIDWRPVADPVNGFTCTDGNTSFLNPTSGAEQCGLVQLANFNLNATLPGTEIYTISINTGNDGSGNPMPTDSLNLGINPFAPTFGTDPQPDTAYYSCSGASGLGPAVACNGAVNADTGWASIGEGAIDFAPEPATFGLIGFGLLGLGIVARKKKNDKV